MNFRRVSITNKIIDLEEEKEKVGKHELKIFKNWLGEFRVD